VPVAYPLTVAGFAGTELSRTFGNTQGGLPFTVVITPDGTVKYRKMGRVHADERARYCLGLDPARRRQPNFTDLKPNVHLGLRTCGQTLSRQRFATQRHSTAVI
jgi:hypothetical protein